MRAAASLVVSALVLGGCVLPAPPAGEDLRKDALPAVAVPPQWVAPSGTGAVAANWVATFNDAQLEALVNEALANNLDLRVAAARVETAAAVVSAAGGMLYPQVSVGARGGGKMSGDNSGLQGVGLFANWELDLWGRVRAGRESASMTHAAAVEDYQYARQSIAALVAKSWFLATEAASQRAVAEEMLAASQRLLDLSRDRLRVGKGDEYDVAQAEAAVPTYADLVVQATQARLQALRAIEILVGRYPAAALAAPVAVPSYPGPVPPGLPSELLERRPDVRAAERRVAAAFHRVTEAQAARLPRIALVASGTSVSSDLLVLKNHDNPVWGLGATIAAPLFTGGALQAQVDVRTAEQKAAVADYGRVGARAFAEVEDALSAAFLLEQRVGILARAQEAQARSLQFARVRLDVGSADQRAVQQQQLALHAARTALLRAQTERLVQRVNLHLALGGGFAPP
jgi:NodT family efflux transporter outer membrane factor (OMF) lipoprotein